MKNKKVLFLLLLTLTAVFFGSCSSDDEKKEAIDGDCFEQILDKQLSKDVVTLLPGEEFAFSSLADCYIISVEYAIVSGIDSESGRELYQYQSNKVNHDESLIQQYNCGFLRIDHPDKRNYSVQLIEGVEIPEGLRYVSIVLWGVKDGYMPSYNHIIFDVSEPGISNEPLLPVVEGEDYMIASQFFGTELPIDNNTAQEAAFFV